MRFSRALIPTTAQVRADAPSLGAAMLARGGLAQLVGPRLVAWLPSGRRVLERLGAIVASELEAIDAHPIDLGAHPDAAGAAALLRACSCSHKQLPITLHQLDSRAAHAFAFDLSADWARSSQRRLEALAQSVLERCALPAATAEGIGSTVFWLAGEPAHERIALDRATGYAATVDAAPRPRTPPAVDASVKPIETVLTPGIQTARDVADHLGVDLRTVIKTLVYEVDGALVAACVRGDRALSDACLARELGGGHVRLASPERVLEATGAGPGFVGPIGLGIPIIADVDLEGIFSAVCGANEADTHLREVDLSRDASIERYARLARARPGDLAPSGQPYEWIAARVLARIAARGDHVTAAVKCTITDGAGGRAAPHLTTAFLDLEAIVCAVADRVATATGIEWPVELAPFDAMISVLHPDDAVCLQAGERLYRELAASGLEVLLDDRPGRVGSKLADAELVGATVRLVAGTRTAAAGRVEIRHAGVKEPLEVSLENATGTALGVIDLRRKHEKAG